jgi:hypothetical protein
VTTNNQPTTDEQLVPFALRVAIDQTMWRALIETHPEPGRFREAWNLQLPQLREREEAFRSAFPEMSGSKLVFTRALGSIVEMFHSAIARKTAEAMQGKAFP